MYNYFSFFSSKNFVNIISNWYYPFAYVYINPWMTFFKIFFHLSYHHLIISLFLWLLLQTINTCIVQLFNWQQLSSSKFSKFYHSFFLILNFDISSKTLVFPWLIATVIIMKRNPKFFKYLLSFLYCCIVFHPSKWRH